MARLTSASIIHILRHRGVITNLQHKFLSRLSTTYNWQLAIETFSDWWTLAIDDKWSVGAACIIIYRLCVIHLVLPFITTTKHDDTPMKDIGHSRQQANMSNKKPEIRSKILGWLDPPALLCCVNCRLWTLSKVTKWFKSNPPRSPRGPANAYV